MNQSFVGVEKANGGRATPQAFRPSVLNRVFDHDL